MEAESRGEMSSWLRRNVDTHINRSLPPCPTPSPSIMQQFMGWCVARYIDSRVTPETSHRKRFPEALSPPRIALSWKATHARASERPRNELFNVIIIVWKRRRGKQVRYNPPASTSITALSTVVPLPLFIS